MTDEYWSGDKSATVAQIEVNHIFCVFSSVIPTQSNSERSESTVTKTKCDQVVIFATPDLCLNRIIELPLNSYINPVCQTISLTR